MSRLIDADKLKQHYAWWENGTAEMTLDEAKKTFDTIIDVQPTVDAVEVVRCKDCIYYGDHGDGEMACAMMILYPNKPTDYCSLGERKEDDKTN